MIQKLASFLFLIFAITSCGVEPCDYDCSEGTISMKLVFLDSETEENIFRNGTAHIKNLKIYHDNQEVDFIYHQLKNQILLGPFKELKTDEDYHFKVNSELLTTLTFGIDEIVNDCCTNYEFSDVSASDAEVSLNDTGIYHIYIEP